MLSPSAGDGMRVTANGIDFHCRIEAREGGLHVMLCNALTSNLSMWDPQVPTLAERLRVLRCDARGLA